MSDTFTITSARNAGEKDNPHGGRLVKWYLNLADSPAGTDDVYCQKKPGNDLSPGMEITGRLEKGEYGWRLFPEAQQGGSFSQHVQRGNGLSKDEYWSNRDQRDVESQARQGRAHAQEMALRWAAITWPQPQEIDEPELVLHRDVEPIIDWFHQDVQRFPLDADVGGGTSADSDPSVSQASAADVSAETHVGGGSDSADVHTPADVSPEASPAQKRRLTNEFKKVGLVPEVMRAVVMVRCRSEKATKDGASSLIQDLVDGATAESLIAEVWDAKRAGDPVGIRAAALIPENSPVDTEGLPELDADGKAKYGVKDESDVPF